MKKTVLLAALAPILLFALPANAAKWVGIATGKDQARIEADAASLHSPAEGKWRLWYRENHAKPKIQDSGAFSYSRLTTLAEFQCEKRLAAVIQRTYAAANGSELKTESGDTPEAAPIVPESNVEAAFDYACRRRSKPTEAKPVSPPAPPPPAPVAAAHEQGSTLKSAKKGGKDGGKEEASHGVPHWSYAGAAGPENWGALGNEFALCGVGQYQSPIDIRRTVKADLPPIQFAYKPVPLSIVDNGHSIKVDTAGAGGISIDGENYDLVQFHFHKPSEEKIAGKTFDMVAHLVHQSKAGKLAVVAVLMDAGKEQPLIRTLWTHLPLEKNKPVSRTDVVIDPGRILPANRSYYTFLGSLTTPPCSEGVLWLVLKNSVQVSKEQLAGFATIYRNNVRPVQPVNGRVIKESR